MPETAWRSRIIGTGTAAPDQLLANPRNWRIHPKAQQDALAGVLDQVGWVQNIIVNQRTGYVVDGHARVAMAISREEPEVPVVYVDLSEEEEGLVLASLDPLAGMAGVDKDQLASLMESIQIDDDALREALKGTGFALPEAPDDFPEVGDDIKTDFECPQCHYSWSGKPK